MSDLQRAQISSGRLSADSLDLESVSRLAIRWQFNKYGMINGHVKTVSPDAVELPDVRKLDRKDGQEHLMPPSGFRALVALDSRYLERDGTKFQISV